MHLPTLLTSLVTLGLPLVTLTSAVTLDTTTSASTSCTTFELSRTYSASPSNSTSPQTIEEYIKDKLAQEYSNSTTSNITSIKRVQGHGMTIEVPTCCWNGCRTCSSKICGKGVNGCNEWPVCAHTSLLVFWCLDLCFPVVSLIKGM